MPVDPDRVVITSGTSEGIELALTALAEPGDEVLVPVPTYPLYTAVLAKIGARPVFYRTRSGRRMAAGRRAHRRLITPATRALVVIDPNNPTGATYPATSAAGCSRSPTTTTSRCSPTRSTRTSRSTVRSTRSPASIRTRRSSRSRRCRRPTSRRAGARAGWPSAGPNGSTTCSRRSRSWPTAGSAATGPMEHAIVAALNGDRSHQQDVSRCAARTRATLTDRTAQRHRRHVASCRRRRRSTRCRKVTLPPGTTDEDYVLALLRATGVLCVYGSGFGTKPEDGFFRVVFLASPARALGDLRR